MARKFKDFVARPKPRKRPGVHKKSRNKHEKRQQKNRWHLSFNILVSRYERNKGE